MASKLLTDHPNIEVDDGVTLLSTLPVVTDSDIEPARITRALLTMSLPTLLDEESVFRLGGVHCVALRYEEDAYMASLVLAACRHVQNRRIRAAWEANPGVDVPYVRGIDLSDLEAGVAHLRTILQGGAR